MKYKLTSLSSSIGPFNYQTVGHTVFAVGRFLSAFAGLFVKPRWILLFLYIGMIVTAACAMNFVGSAGVAMIVLFMFFEVSFLNIILINSRLPVLLTTLYNSLVSSPSSSQSPSVDLAATPNPALSISPLASLEGLSFPSS